MKRRPLARASDPFDHERLRAPGRPRGKARGVRSSSRLPSPGQIRRIAVLITLPLISAAFASVPLPAAAATADHLVFTMQPPDPVTAGQMFSVVVNVQDASNLPVIGESIDLNDDSTNISANAVSDASGDATFGGLQVNASGTDTLHATDQSAGLSMDSNPFTVDAGPAAVVAFVQQPAHTVIGHVITPAVTVFVGDGIGAGNGNPVSGIGVTLSLASGSGTLSGTLLQMTDSSGLATFADLSIALSDNYTLTAVANGGSNPTATSASFLIDTCDVTLGPSETYAATGPNQVICAYGGNDTVKQLQNGDTVVGRGPGNTVDLSSAPTGVRVNLPTGVGADGSGNSFTIQSVQNVIGSPFDDVISAVAPQDGRVVFDRTVKSLHGEIITLNANGTQSDRIVSNPHDDYNPAWSGTGERIAFASDRSGNYDVYSVTVSGTGLKRLTHDRAFDGMPAYSPDGSRIAFVSNRSGSYELYTMRAGGSGVRRLTHDHANDWYPSWSPDGSRIAFQSDRTGKDRIYVVGADGKKRVPITSASVPSSEPDWSPDGSRIVFCRTVSGKRDLFTISLVGRPTLTRITRSRGDEFDPAWSADGSRIAYAYGRGTRLDLYTVGVHGVARRSVTTSPAIDEFPDWQTVCASGSPVNCGDSTANVIRGGAGDDVIYGGGGNDSIFGEGGNDLIAGGSGDDAVSGGPGRDIVSGGPGAGSDSILGGSGDDLLNGLDGKGNDQLNGGAGQNDCVRDGSDQHTQC